MCCFRVKFKDELTKRTEQEEALQHYVSVDHSGGLPLSRCTCVHDVLSVVGV